MSKAYSFDLRIMTPPEASAYPIELWSNYQTVVLAGGDGTVSSQLCRFAGEQKTFHVIPLGTGNDLAREYGLCHLTTCKEEEILSYLDSTEKRPVQVWECTFPDSTEPSLRFMNYLSIGLDAAVIEKFSRSRASKPFGPWTRLANRFAYAWFAFWELVRSEELVVAELVATPPLKINPPEFIRALCFSNMSSLMGLGWQVPRGDPSDAIIELRFVESIWNYLNTVIPIHAPAKCRSAEKWIMRLQSGIQMLQFDGEPKRLQSMAQEIAIRPVGQVQIAMRNSSLSHHHHPHGTS